MIKLTRLGRSFVLFAPAVRIRDLFALVYLLNDKVIDFIFNDHLVFFFLFIVALVAPLIRDILLIPIG